jgi:polysaccharide biosynthesis protein PslH
MKILMLTQVLPYPPDSGPKIKTYNLIKFLAQTHEITLVSYTRGDQSLDVECLKRFCCQVIPVPIRRSKIIEIFALMKSFISSIPWVITRDDRKEMRNVIADLQSRNSFDIVHADQLNMVQFVNLLPKARSVLDAHNALWVVYQRLAKNSANPLVRLFLEREYRLLKRYEGKISRSVDAVVTVSQEDKAAFEEAIGTNFDIPIVPIAIDTAETKLVSRKKNADHILHIGTMFWPPNVDGIHWFLNNVYPILLNLRPDIHLDIVGARPPKEIIDAGHLFAGVSVTGFVKDPTEYLENAGVLIVPLRAGGGMRVKILEALAKGLPVVTTSIGCEGIAVENGRHLLIADSPQDFANAILQVIDDNRIAQLLIDNGRKLVETLYDYEVVYRTFNTVYMKVTSGD